ncbi:family 43 glycosylhydrolase [Candidatus Sumerlaeota bacterium]|nr:family 43 glycosylhydrolase [Candidatus Sumerlaeota bacterium]
MTDRISSQAPNPLLPRSLDADPEPRVWADGRMYIYGSRDQAHGRVYCSEHYHVLSSDDLVHWTDHGVSFSMSDTPEGSGRLLYACDCECKDGVYYLYYCTDNGSLGVAMSDSPTGPFRNAQYIGGLPNQPGIDPAVFIDDDGQAYLYWGQTNNVRAAKLKPNMVEVEKESIMQPLSLAEHFFHEGSAMIKRNGVYYFVYADESRGRRPSCLGYATAPAPLGPFTYRGVIIDNLGCDPGVWNNHGRIIEFKGQWYVFYHRSIQNSKCPRQVCAEPITFTEDGLIPEVEMTSRGVGAPLDLTRQTPAHAACILTGNARLEMGEDARLSLQQIHDGDTALFRGVCFGRQARNFTVRCSTPAKDGVIEARIDDSGSDPVAVLDLSASSVPLITDVPLEDVHDLHLTFKTSAPMSLDWFQFG